MSSNTMYVVLEADNIASEISLHGPYATKDEARYVMRKHFRTQRTEFKLEERVVEESSLAAASYNILLRDGDYFYGQIKEISVEEVDTEAERWIKAVKDHMEAKNVSIPQEESELAHIAEEAQHYAAKDPYFVGGFWNAIALATQDYVDAKKDDEAKKEDET